MFPTRTARTFCLAAMLFCSHAGETTVGAGPNVATSSDSKVSGFDRPHVSKKVSDSKVSTLESGFKSFRIRRSDSSDACGRKAYPERKVCGFKSVRIRVNGAYILIRIYFETNKLLMSYYFLQICHFFFVSREAGPCFKRLN